MSSWTECAVISCCPSTVHVFIVCYIIPRNYLLVTIISWMPFACNEISRMSLCRTIKSVISPVPTPDFFSVTMQVYVMCKGGLSSSFTWGQNSSTACWPQLHPRSQQNIGGRSKQNVEWKYESKSYWSTCCQYLIICWKLALCLRQFVIWKRKITWELGMIQCTVVRWHQIFDVNELI